MTNPCVPKEFRQFAQKSQVIIKKHAILGTNTIVLPGVTIGEGAATGAQTVVNRDLKDWAIYLGFPARMLHPREKEIILKMEKELREKYM